MSSAGSELAPATAIVTTRMAPLQNRLSIIRPINWRRVALLRRPCARVAAPIRPSYRSSQGEPRTTPSLKNTR